MSPECDRLQERVDELEGRVLKLTEYIFERLLAGQCTLINGQLCGHPERTSDYCGDNKCPLLRCEE
jgi:hypothetical protein